MAALVAGVDSSTQSTTVVVCDADDGTVVAQASSPHEVSGTGGARESDPERWEEALAEALRATGRAQEVRAVAVAGQQHGLVCLDGDGRPLRPAVLWNDTRSGREAARLREELGGTQVWADRLGVVPVASFPVTTWAWLRGTEPDVTSATRAVRLPHDFLAERLTGRAVTDRGDASGTGWWAASTQDYDTGVLGLPSVGLDPALLPEVLAPSQAAGEVTREAGARLGLRPGTVVGAGTGDNMAAALGVGAAPGVPLVSLGTSGVAATTAETPAADADGVVAGFADATGRWLPLCCTLNCTLAVDAFARLLGRDRDAVEDGGEVVVLPFLDGERTPDVPDARATVTGLTHATTPGQVLRAAYEGAAASLLDGVARVAVVQAPPDPDGALLVLGGGSRGSTWQTVLSRLSGRPLDVAAGLEAAARGAAVQAAAVLSGREVTEVAAAWPAPETVHVEAVPRDEEVVARLRAAREGVVQRGA